LESGKILRMTGSNTDWIDLPDEGVLAVRGPDARKFLNGQLSQQLLSLGAGETVLAGLHNPQGRTLAILRVVADGPQDVLCVLPRSLLEGVLSLLRKYLLRSKAALTDETPLWRVQGHWPAPGAAAAATGVAGPGPAAATHSPVRLLWPHTSDGRYMRLERCDAAIDSAGTASAPSVAPNEPSPAAPQAAWHRADIAAGLPRIYRATQGEFVAQMLNLDVLEGISFNKGCYTGQEVIARAHFRGRVKRRLQRFTVAVTSTFEATTLAPGEQITLADGRDAIVVDSAAAHEGRMEFLAIARYATATDSASSEDASPSETTRARIEATPLPLPYELPAAG
jgi:folate-binding protein YgfZ